MRGGPLRPMTCVRRNAPGRFAITTGELSKMRPPEGGQCCTLRRGQVPATRTFGIRVRLSCMYSEAFAYLVVCQVSTLLVVGRKRELV